MFSSLTTEGAQATLDALDAGAVDFLLKRLDKLSHNKAEFTNAICNKIRTLGSRAAFFTKQVLGKDTPPFQKTPNRAESSKRARLSNAGELPLGKYKIVVIGASTGGPVAVQSITSALPSDFTVPILVVQHMPAAFTKPFARRLDALSKLSIKEAEDGDILEAGRIYVAPGGKQMVLENKSTKAVVRIRDSYGEEQYKPSVDITYKSVSGVYGKAALAIILTGMGSDGREGASLLKQAGSAIWAQDEYSSIVYGMPQAVIDAGLADRVLPINEIARQLALGI